MNNLSMCARLTVLNKISKTISRSTTSIDQFKQIKTFL